MKLTALAVALLLVAAPLSSAIADAPPKRPHQTEKERQIRKLLELTGAAKLGAQVMKQMLDSFRSSLPNVPQASWDQLAKELDANELVDLIVPVYDKQLTEGEIKELIKFYETPVGKKLIQVMPAITQESMQVGQEWGRKIGQRVMDKLKQQAAEKK